MDSQTIRRTFLDFFEERGHTIVPSSSLIPDDPTLLFTTAGMVQFKPYFLGEKTPPYSPPRAASVQKAFRTTDLEIVGTTSRHLTFFEMLGNFSFGDYFKEGAIRYGWELVTGPFGLEPDRCWATVFTTDDEAAEIWEKVIGVPPEKILRRGKEHGNFWDMGVAGPCGPCSEILYDRGPDFGEEYQAGAELDEERYVEIWNLVFMQNVQNDAGEIVGDLPQKNIDTGLGMARLAAVLQGVPTSFDIDSMAPLVRKAEEITGATYGASRDADVALRVMAEHARAMSFLIADGVLPSNESRGYVLRRLIRRAVRYARKAGVGEPFLGGLIDVVVGLFGDFYPEVLQRHDLIKKIAEREEARFDYTLRQGLGMLEDEIGMAKSRGEKTLSGEFAFKLHDTYGFPLDLSQDIAGEEGLDIDLEDFERQMLEQRTRARAARPGAEKVEAAPLLHQTLETSGKTQFEGYERLDADAEILAIASGMESTAVLPQGREGQVVLDRTPFYAESGGQLGDRGEIRTATGTFVVEKTTYGLPGLIVHTGEVKTGEIRAGQQASAQVDPSYREGVRQSHTATHVLHWALREFLGDHARQQGSLVAPGRLRFDFSHFEQVPQDRLSQIEEEVNRRVLVDDSVRAFETTFDYAMSIGAMALFGEKYGDFVRVVEVGEYSKELCGGTHVHHTGQIGVVTLLSEGSVAAGTRRVEAYTGMHGLAHLNAQAEKLRKAAETLKTDPERIVEAIEKREAAFRSMQAELSTLKGAGRQEEIDSILRSESVKPVGDSKLVTLRRDGASVDELRELAESLSKSVGSGVIVVGGAADGRANIIAAASRDLVDSGTIKAGALVKEGAGLLGGGGGGPDHLAIGGGSKSSELDLAISRVEQKAREAIERSS